MGFNTVPLQKAIVPGLKAKTIFEDFSPLVPKPFFKAHKYFHLATFTEITASSTKYGVFRYFNLKNLIVLYNILY